jgi:hypothetical protein
VSAGNGNSGVAQIVKDTKGAIGYVDLSDAIASDLQTAAVTAVLAGVGIAIALRDVRRRLPSRRVPLWTVRAWAGARHGVALLRGWSGPRGSGVTRATAAAAPATCPA